MGDGSLLSIFLQGLGIAVTAAGLLGGLGAWLWTKLRNKTEAQIVRAEERINEQVEDLEDQIDRVEVKVENVSDDVQEHGKSLTKLCDRWDRREGP